VTDAAQGKKEAELREETLQALQMAALRLMEEDATGAPVSPVSAIKTPIAARPNGTASALTCAPLTAGLVAALEKPAGVEMAPLMDVHRRTAPDVMDVPVKPVPVVRTATAARPHGTMCA